MGTVTRVLVAVLGLAIVVPAGADVPRTVESHRRQCLEDRRSRACRTWIRETALPFLCRPVGSTGEIELDPARALGIGPEGRRAVAPPCADLPDEQAPGIAGGESFRALHLVLSAEEEDPEQFTWGTLVLAALEISQPRDRSPSVLAMTELEAWEARPFGQRIASRLAPGALLATAQVSFRQAAWEDAAARALAFLHLFRWDRRAGLARLLAARSLALAGHFEEALHHVAQVQRHGTDQERYRARLLAGLVRFHQVASSAGGVRLVHRRDEYRTVRGMTKAFDLAVAPDGSVGVAGKEGVVVVDGRRAGQAKALVGKDCRTVAFDRRGGLLAVCRVPGAVRLVPDPRKPGAWHVDTKFDAVPRAADQRARERWTRLFQDVDDIAVDLEQGTWLHEAGQDQVRMIPPSRSAAGARTMAMLVSATQRPRGFGLLPGGRLVVLGNRARKGMLSFWTTVPGRPPKAATVIGPSTVREVVDMETDALGWAWILAKEGYRKYRILVVEPDAWKVRADSGTLQGVDMYAITPDAAGGAWIVAGNRNRTVLRHYVPGEVR